MKRLLILASMLIAFCVSAGTTQMLMVVARKNAGGAPSDTYFTVTFLTGTTPTNIILNAGYAGAASTEAQAQYDAGDGVWTNYTSRTITMQGDYFKIKGDWRDAAGTYEDMFYNTFGGAGYTCKFSGTLDYAATAVSAYRSVFRACDSVTSIEDNPFQPIVGSPAGYMFAYSFYNMSSVTGSLPIGFLDTSGMTGSPASGMFFYACQNISSVTGSLPTGFMDTSGLTGSPAGNMFYETCYGMSSVTGSLPTGFMDTSGLTGAPAVSMFSSACYGMSSVTGSLPTGFMDTSGLTGAPAVSMFNTACRNMSSITGGNINIGTNITMTTANLDTDNWLDFTMYGCSSWTGQMYYGTSVIHTVITPTNDLNTFNGCTSMPDYGTINANWK